MAGIRITYPGDGDTVRLYGDKHRFAVTLQMGKAHQPFLVTLHKQGDPDVFKTIGEVLPMAKGSKQDRLRRTAIFSVFDASDPRFPNASHKFIISAYAIDFDGPEPFVARRLDPDDHAEVSFRIVPHALKAKDKDDEKDITVDYPGSGEEFRQNDDSFVAFGGITAPDTKVVGATVAGKNANYVYNDGEGFYCVGFPDLELAASVTNAKLVVNGDKSNSDPVNNVYIDAV